MASPKSTATKAREAEEREEALDLTISDPSAFKKRRLGKVLKLPSDLVIRVQRVDLQTLVLKGNVPNPLMPMIQEIIAKGEKADVEAMVGMDKGELDLDTIREMYEMVDMLVNEAVVEPKIHYPPAPEEMQVWNEENPESKIDSPDELRHDDRVYLDDMEDEDKMFIFQWLMGGTEDIASFREEARTTMASVGQGKGRKPAAKRTGGSAPR